jgi:hypothetical protein
VVDSTEESNSELDDKTKKVHELIRKIEGSNFCSIKFICILFALTLTVLIVFLQGGRTIKSIIGANRCDTKGWLVFAGYIVMLICVSLICTYLVKTE